MLGQYSIPQFPRQETEEAHTPHHGTADIAPPSGTSYPGLQPAISLGAAAIWDDWRAQGGDCYLPACMTWGTCSCRCQQQRRKAQKGARCGLLARLVQHIGPRTDEKYRPDGWHVAAPGSPRPGLESNRDEGNAWASSFVMEN
jgi:hypothetical protein